MFQPLTTKTHIQICNWQSIVWKIMIFKTSIAIDVFLVFFIGKVLIALKNFRETNLFVYLSLGAENVFEITMLEFSRRLFVQVVRLQCGTRSILQRPTQ